MNKQTGNQFFKAAVAAMVMMSLTGCMGVQHGAPHPFATMFRDYQQQGEPLVIAPQPDRSASAVAEDCCVR